MPAGKKRKKLIAVALVLAVPGTIAATTASATITPNESSKLQVAATLATSEVEWIKVARSNNRSVRQCRTTRCRTMRDW